VENDELDREFIDLTPSAWAMDYYQPRLAILSKIREELPRITGTLLDVGCGRSPYKKVLVSSPARVTKYIGMDFPSRQYTKAPDLEWDGVTIPLPAGSVDSALATEVLEHCPDPKGVLREINRVLKPGGFLLATVPFLWPLHDNPHDEFRYTPFSLERFAREAGFEDVKLTAMGGWDAALATMIGLWVRRRPMSDLRRRILQRLLLPFYTQLLRLDRPPADFVRSCMITGLALTGSKPRMVVS